MSARSTLTLLGRLTVLSAAGQATILRGNTADMFVAAEGEPRRLPHLLAGWAAEHGRSTVLYSMAGGARQLTAPGRTPAPLRLPAADAPPAEALEQMLGQFRTSTQPIQLVVDYADLAMPEVSGALLPEQNRVMEMLPEFVADPAVTASGHRIAVIEKVGAMDVRLSRLPGFVVVDVSLPDHAERSTFLRRLLEPKVGPALRLEPSLSAEHLAALAGGLTLEDLYRARQESQAGPPLGAAWVQAAKAVSLRRLAGDNLIVYPPGGGMAQVAGLPQMRRIVRESLATGRFPGQLLLAGPPGVGKTLVSTFGVMRQPVGV